MGECKWVSKPNEKTSLIEFNGVLREFDEDIKTPIKYFTKYFDANMINLTVEQSNLFAIEKGFFPFTENICWKFIGV